MIGVGVGPGDVEQVTVRAVRELREAEMVFVPVLDENEPGRAELTVRHYVTDPARVRRVVFALNDRGGITPRRTRAWDAAAQVVCETFASGIHRLAFATLGDPNVYSTFTYLARTVRAMFSDIAVETVPGITAMQDLAARSGTVLVEGDETLTLVPVVRGQRPLTAALAGGGTVVAYKCGRHMPEVLRSLRRTGRTKDAVFGAALGLPDEDIRLVSDLSADRPFAYLSTVIVPAARTVRGGKL